MNQYYCEQIELPEEKFQTHSCHTCCFLNDDLFIFGGETEDENQIVNYLFKFNKEKKMFNFHKPEFENPTDLPEQRRNHAICSFKNKFYLFGGDSFKELNDFWEYNLETNRFTRLVQNGDAPSKRRYHCLTYYKEKIFCFGGEFGYKLLNDIYCYNLQDFTWKKLYSKVEPKPRRYSSLVTIGNCLYLFGGRDENKRMNDLWEFNTDTNQWKELISFHGKAPSIRAAHIGVSYKDSYFIFGGNSFEKEQNDLYEYNVLNKEWKEIMIDSDITPRYWHSGCVNSNGELYISGGFWQDINLRDLWRIQLNPTSLSIRELVFKYKNYYNDVLIVFSK